jgi:hypothetical protein
MARGPTCLLTCLRQAGRLVEELRSGVGPQSDPKSLKEAQLVRLHQLLHEVRFADPKGAHLSPAGGRAGRRAGGR